MEENKIIETEPKEVKVEENKPKEITINLFDLYEKHSKQIEELNKKFLEVELSKENTKKPKKELEL